MAALASTALIFVLRRLAPVLGLIDHPGGRKLHAAPVPVVGGLAIVVAVLPFVLVSKYPLADNLAAAIGLLAIVGAVDDREHIQPRYRFALEAVAGVILILAGVSVRYLGNLLGFGPIGTSFIAPVFTLFCIIGAINAFNMIDGIDGLSGSLAIVAAAWFTVVAFVSSKGAIAIIGLATIGALVGFLSFNFRTPFRHRAAVFMGDAGTMVLGLLFAWFAIELAGREPSFLTPIGAVWVIAVPLIDMWSVMLHRVLSGVSPFAADRWHLHHALVDRGVPVSRAVALITGAGVLCGAMGVGASYAGVPEWVMFAGFIAVWFLVYRWNSKTHTRRGAR